MAFAVQNADAKCLRHAMRGLFQVECAINRATKEKRVTELTEVLQKSSVAFGVRYNKIKVSPRGLGSTLRNDKALPSLIRAAYYVLSLGAAFKDFTGADPVPGFERCDRWQSE